MASVQKKGALGTLNDLYSLANFNSEMIENPSSIEKRFIFKIQVNNMSFTGTGPSKKQAKNEAATKVLSHHSINPNASEFRIKVRQAKSRDQNSGNPQQTKRGNHQNQNQNHNQNQNRNRNQPLRNLPSSTRNEYNWMKFCNSYRNGFCSRQECKYLHVSRRDEDVFLASGNVPDHVLEEALRKAIVEDISPSGTPTTCKAYLDGHCRRNSCPFRHVSRRDFMQIVFSTINQQFDNKLRQQQSLPQSLPHNSFVNPSPGIMGSYIDSKFGQQSVSHNGLINPYSMINRESDSFSSMKNVNMISPYMDLGQKNVNKSSSYMDPRMDPRLRSAMDPRQSAMIEDLQEQLREMQLENNRLRGQVGQDKNMDSFGKASFQNREIMLNTFEREQRQFHSDIQSYKKQNEEMRRMLQQEKAVKKMVLDNKAQEIFSSIIQAKRMPVQRSNVNTPYGVQATNFRFRQPVQTKGKVNLDKNRKSVSVTSKKNLNHGNMRKGQVQNNKLNVAKTKQGQKKLNDALNKSNQKKSNSAKSKESQKKKENADPKPVVTVTEADQPKSPSKPKRERKKKAQSKPQVDNEKAENNPEVDDDIVDSRRRTSDDDVLVEDGNASATNSEEEEEVESEKETKTEVDESKEVESTSDELKEKTEVKSSGSESWADAKEEAVI